MYIYKTICLINGKIYIGQSSKLVKSSMSYLGSGVSLSLAIKVYGKHNFSKEILKDNIKIQHQLDIWEQIYIKKFNSCDEEIGYNIMPGTTNGFGHVNPAKLAIVKDKITIASNNYWNSTEGNEYRKSITGNGNPFFGKHHTEEQIKQYSLTRVGKDIGNFGKKHSNMHSMKFKQERRVAFKLWWKQQKVI